MRAQILNAPEAIDRRPLQWREIETPEPESGQLLVRVRACGVCRTDLHVVEGELDLARQKRPVVPGHQIVGVVEACGDDVQHLAVGDRVGVAWLHRACGACRFCAAGRENLCPEAEFTGWTRDGGYAEYVLAAADSVYPIPEDLGDQQAAPLLCAGIIGYRCLRQCEIEAWSGARLGMYGFGAAGHIAIQIARHRGAEVYVMTRHVEKHQRLAEELGAAWVGGAFDAPPHPLDASIIFAPAGEIVPAALRALDRGGRLVCGGIHMSPIPRIDYRDLYFERVIRSVTNNTRADGRAFLEEAAEANVRTEIESFPLADANEALDRLKNKAIRGAAVLTAE